MNKLVICSFEGALIDEGDAIAYRTMLEIDRVRKEGLYFCVVSSKDLEFVMEYNKDFPFLDYIIVCNGSCIYDVNKGEIIFKKNIAPLVVKKIVKLFSQYKIVIYTSKKICDTADTDFSDVVKIDVIGTNSEQLTNIVESLSNIGVKLNIIVDQSQGIVEIVAGSVNRENSIKYIVKELELKKRDVFIIGSKAEDKNIIEKYGGVAVSNADKAVKNVAKYISNKEDSLGVSELLEKFLH